MNFRKACANFYPGFFSPFRIGVTYWGLAKAGFEMNS